MKVKGIKRPYDLYIESLKAQNLLSFGKKGISFPRLSRYNLFIGKNSSGKSNSLELIRGIKTKLERVRNTVDNTKIEFQEELELYKLCLDFDKANQNTQRSLSRSPHMGDLDYKILMRDFPNYIPYDYNIKFQGGILVKGDYDFYRRKVLDTSSQLSNSEFYEQLALKTGKDNSLLSFIDFGLQFIFQRHISLNKLGDIYEESSKGIEPALDSSMMYKGYSRLASGYLNVAKIILEIIVKKQCSVIVLDEPELHLEPRAARRCLFFLIWICTYTLEDESLSDHEKNIVSYVNGEWSRWTKKNHSAYFEKNNELLRKIRFRHPFLVDELSEKVEIPQILPKQLFIGSHSSVILNEMLRLGKAASVYELKITQFKEKVNHNLGLTREEENLDREQMTYYSSARLINSLGHDILDNLGCKGSDLLQTNGIIWVEGPSDIIYIENWISLYLKSIEANTLFSRGVHYDYQFYGGCLLNFCCFDKSSSPSEDLRNLVRMFSFSRNAFVIIDSDAFYKEGRIIDKSNFKRAKKYIKEELEQLNSNRIGIWFDDNNVEYATIENYIDQKSISLCGRRKSNESKVKYAKRVTSNWLNSKSINDFEPILKEHIKEIVELIDSWND